MTDFTITEDFLNSKIEFRQRIGNNDNCYVYVSRAKLPGGFIYEKCGWNVYWLSSKNIYNCRKCGHQYSLTAGTIIHETKKPITYCFKAMWLFTTRNWGVIAVNLHELLYLDSYHTTRSWLQKLRRCTLREDLEKLSGCVKVVEFFISGKKPRKHGRGAEGKTIFLAAIEGDTVEDPETDYNVIVTNKIEWTKSMVIFNNGRDSQ